LYLELSFKIIKIILRINFKLHFEPEATKSLTPDPSPKGEGSRIKDLKGTTEKTEPLARRSQKSGKTEKKDSFHPMILNNFRISEKFPIFPL
jgi:hypothetical protein